MFSDHYYTVEIQCAFGRLREDVIGRDNGGWEGCIGSFYCRGPVNRPLLFEEMSIKIEFYVYLREVPKAFFLFLRGHLFLVCDLWSWGLQ